MKRFQLFSELRKYFQRLCQWKEKFRGMWSYLSQRKTRDKKITFSKIIHSSSNKRTLQSFISVVPVNGFKMGSLTTKKKRSHWGSFNLPTISSVWNKNFYGLCPLWSSKPRLKMGNQQHTCFVLAKLCKRCFPTHQSATALLNCKTGLSFFPIVSKAKTIERKTAST